MKRKRKSSLKKRPFLLHKETQENPITPSKVLNPPQNCHQPPSKHQNCWYPCQPNPNPVPPPQDLYIEIEKWERKQTHHPSSARFRQPKAKKIERERVLNEIVKKKRERDLDLEKQKIEREREYDEIKKKKRGKRVRLCY